MTDFIYLIIGGVLGYLGGMSTRPTTTEIINRRITAAEIERLSKLAERYKKVIRDLVADNKRLVKELEKK
jgi:hypothetical protein